MKRHRLGRLAACAGASLLACGAASAAGSGSSLNLYGVIDACLVSYRSATGAPLQLNGGGCYYGSRYGFRGNEDLGGGLHAYFVLEGGFAVDTGMYSQGRLFGRKSLVGLGGGMGAIEAGRDYSPTFYLETPIDPMQQGIGGVLSTMWSGSPGTSAGRTDNAISYASPTYAGFSTRLQYAFGEQTGPLPGGGASSRGLNVMYQDKGLVAGAAYAGVRNSADTGTDSATTVGASYDFGRFSLAALAQSGGWEGTRSVATPASATSIFSRRYNSYLLGGTVKIGGDTLRATYKRYDDRTTSNFDATILSAVYVHPLSRRTQLYLGISRLKNVRASSYGAFDGNGYYNGVSPGGSSRILDLGIAHFF